MGPLWEARGSRGALTMPLAEMEWDLQSYLRIFRLHRWLIVLVTITCGILASAYLSTKPNIYRTAARILIETQSPQVVQFRELTPYTAAAGSQVFLMTEIQVITSRAVLSRVIDQLHLASFPPFSKAQDPVGELQGMIGVELKRGTKLIDISVTGTKPDLIARVANAVAAIYARENLERRQEMTTGGVQWLKDEVAKMEEKTRSAQLALQTFLEEHSGVDFSEEQQNTIVQRVKALNDAITDTRKQRIEAETRYREKHPVLLEIQSKERELQLALFDQEQKSLEMSRLSIQYNTLQREVKTGEGIYNSLLTRLKELSVQEGLQTNNVQVVEEARVPKKPIAPNRLQGTLVAVLFGFFAGCIVSFVRESLAKTIQTRSQFENTLEIPFLGAVPLIRLARGRKGSEHLVMLVEPQSTASESIRALRTTLEFLLPTNQPQLLLITSSLPSEGKSLISLNLAIALQELGRKVLLVDGDLRRPTLHRSLQMSLEPGLSGYLQEQVGAEELIQISALAKDLHAVPAGLTPTQPTDLLTSPRLRQLVETWKKEYRYILIDTPPVLAVPDTTALASLADGVLYVLRADRTHRDAAQAGKQRLLDVGAKIIGGILNVTRLELAHGYRYYYYYRGDEKRRRLSPEVPPAAETPAATTPPSA